MDDLTRRLRDTGEQRLRAEPWDDPSHYLNVVAKVSRADGALMQEAADRLDAQAALLREARDAAEEIACMGHDMPATFPGTEGAWRTRRADLMQGAAKDRVEELEVALRIANDALKSYADPTGYTDDAGEQLPPDAVLHPGLLAAQAIAEIAALTAKVERAQIWNEAIEAAASVLTDQDAENVLSLRTEQAAALTAKEGKM